MSDKLDPISKADLDRYFELKDACAALDRESRAKKSEQSKLKAKFESHLKASGKNKISRHGATIGWVDGSPPVSWKDAYIEECGAEAAQELIESAVPAKKLEVIQAA